MRKLLSAEQLAEIEERAFFKLKNCTSVIDARKELESEFISILHSSFSKAFISINSALSAALSKLNFKSGSNILLSGEVSRKLVTTINFHNLTPRICSRENLLAEVDNRDIVLAVFDYSPTSMSELEKVLELSRKYGFRTVEIFNNSDLVGLMQGEYADHLPGWSTDFSLFDVYSADLEEKLGAAGILSSSNSLFSFPDNYSELLGPLKSKLALEVLEEQGKSDLQQVQSKKVELDYNKLVRWEQAINEVTWNISNEALKFLPVDGVFIDVGANTGLFSAQVLSKRNATAYLFEPVPEYMEYCRQRFEGRSNVKVENIALSNEQGTLKLYLGDENLGWNTVVAEKTDSRMTPTLVPAITFDSYAEKNHISKIDLIKIDVEGAEYLVLEGMKKTLSKLSKKPVILCEVGWGKGSHPNWDREVAIFEWLFANGYERFDYNVYKTTDVVFIPKKNLQIEVEVTKSRGQVLSNMQDEKKKPRITLGIPTRNRLDHLSNLIESIQNQTYKNLTILISDDGDKFDLVKEISTRFPAFKFEYTKGPGISLPTNRQHIMDSATTEFVVMCDDDHYLEENCIERLVEAIVGQPNVAIVSAIWPTPSADIPVIDVESCKSDEAYRSDIDDVREGGDFWWKHGCELFKAYHKNAKILDSQIAGGGCLIYRKSLVQLVGGFPTDYSVVSFREDTDMSYRLYLAGYTILIHPGAVAFHLTAEQGGCRDTSSWAYNFVSDGLRFLNKLELWRKQSEQKAKLLDRDPLKLLVFYDEEGWAWWHRANNLKKYLAPEINVFTLKVGESYDAADYDFVLLFDAYLLETINRIPPDKLIVANSCPKLFDQTLEVVNQGYASAGFVNNYETYKKVKNDPRFFCCQNGVDADLFYPSKQIPVKFKACWIGNSKSIGNKGLDLIQGACDKAGIELLVVDASKFENFSDTKNQAWIRDNIYHNSNVLICASEYEGTPNPGLEALACGLPVISTRVGNMTELISNGVNGFLVERSVDSIYSALTKLISSDQNFLRLNARESIEVAWTWTHKAKNYKSMLFELQRRRIFGELKFVEPSQEQITNLVNERMSAYLPPPSLERLVVKKEGNINILSSDFFVSAANNDEVSRIWTFANQLPPFYLHFGGVGDALLLLSTFYDSNPNQVVVSLANSIEALKEFYKNFPKLNDIYLLELSNHSRFNNLMRMVLIRSPKCLGAGCTPENSHSEDWLEGLDIFRKYKIITNPKWALDFAPNKLSSPQVVIAPKGSLFDMQNSKQNVIDPKVWKPLLRDLAARGIKPIVIGTPQEEKYYPVDFGAIDMRSYSFKEQMSLLSCADLVIAADSWAKTFSALLEIPTIVFTSMVNGVFDPNFDCPSSNVFLKPWPSISVVNNIVEALQLSESILANKKDQMMFPRDNLTVSI